MQETDCDCEDAEVSPMEVGHNIYILALQVHYWPIMYTNLFFFKAL